MTVDKIFFVVLKVNVVFDVSLFNAKVFIVIKY